MSSGLDGENKRLVELGEALRTCKMELPVAIGSPLIAWHPYRSDMFAPGLIFEQNVNDTTIFDRLILGDWTTVEYQRKS